MSYLGCPPPASYCELSQAVVVDSPNFYVSTDFGGGVRTLVSTQGEKYPYETVSSSQFIFEAMGFLSFFLILYALLFFKR